MPILEYFRNDRVIKKLFFIHIPRTAGRYITYWFFRNGFDVFYNEYDDKRNGGYELPHLWHPYYNVLPIEDAVHFTIVRNPVDRFKSAIKEYIFYNNLEEDYFNDISYEKLVDVIVDETTNTKSSFYIPQFNFVTDKTLVWKYEDGLDDTFKRWVYNNMGIKLKPTEKSYDREEWDDGSIHPVLSLKTEEMIREYYKEDYKVFNYKN
jgi:hypothetical protein